MQTITLDKNLNIYIIADHKEPSVVLFMGCGYFPDTLMLKDFKRTSYYNADNTYDVTVLEEYSSEGFAAYQALYNPLKVEEPRTVPVQCVETGVVYKTPYQACKELGLSFSAMSCYLQGKKNYKSIKGLHFKRVYEITKI